MRRRFIVPADRSSRNGRVCGRWAGTSSCSGAARCIPETCERSVPHTRQGVGEQHLSARYTFNYLDFELEIEAVPGRSYAVRVLRSPAGEARGTLRLPFDDLKLENYLLALQNALLRSGGQRRKVALPEEQAVQEFGGALFNAVFDGEIRSSYDVSMHEAARQGNGLRLKLSMQAPELASLPWEYLYDARQGRYLCLSRTTPLVRYIEVPQAIEPLAVAPPLRMLGMVSGPADLEPLDLDNEKQRVEHATEHLRRRGLLELTWLEGQGWRDLQRAMRYGPWHIFHFIGHGGFDEYSGEGLIALTGEHGASYRLPASSLAQLLVDHAPLRLVLLNSCDGARGSARDIFSSTAAILVQRGIPSVLAMQFEITDQAAIEFSRSFYEGIADGLPVDAAVTEARKAISLAVANTMEWGTPVLYMRAANGQIFDLLASVPRAQSHAATDSAASSAADRAGETRDATPDSGANDAQLDEEYTRALSAYYTGQWDKAIAILQRIVHQSAGYRDAANKLRQATMHGQLERHWQAGAAAAAAGNWSAALAAYEQVAALDPAYRDVGARVAEAQRRGTVAQLYAEARELYAAGAYDAVLNVLERSAAVDAGYADPDKLRDGARAKLAERERRQELQALYRQSLQLLDGGKLGAARDGFKRVRQLDPAYGDTGALLEHIDRELAAQEQRATVERLVQQARAALAAGDLDGARQRLDELATIAPNSSAVAQIRADLDRHIATRRTAHGAPPAQSQPATPAGQTRTPTESPIAQTQPTVVSRSDLGPAPAPPRATPIDRTAVAPPDPTVQQAPRQTGVGIWMARSKPAVPIWVWWTLASVAGLVCLMLPTYLLGVLLYTLSEQYKDTYAWLFDDYILVAYERLLFPALLLAGAAVLGYLQRRVLERYVPSARWWVWATAVAWLLAVLLWVLVPNWAMATFPDDVVHGKLYCDNGVMCGDLVVPIVLAGVISGALLGVGQWLFLRMRVRAASWWLLGRGLGYAAAAYFVWRSGHSTYSDRLFGSIDFTRLDLVVLVAGVSKAATEGTFWQGWLPLVVAEAIAGVAMALLLANNRRDTGTG